MRKMYNIAVIAFLIALTLCVSAVPSHAENLKAGELSDRCLNFEKAAANDLTFKDSSEATEFGFCLGYFEGWTDGTAVGGGQFMPASDTALSPRNMEGAFRIYMNQHPEAASDIAAIVVLNSLLEANLLKSKPKKTA